MEKIVLLLVLIGIVSSVEWFMKNNPSFVGRENIQVLEEEGMVKVVKFFTPWCKHCRRLKVMLDSEKKKLIGRPVKFYDVNCEEEAHLCHEFGISTYPFTIFIDGHAQVAGKIVGSYEPEVMIPLIWDHIEMSLSHEEHVPYRTKQSTQKPNYQAPETRTQEERTRIPDQKQMQKVKQPEFEELKQQFFLSQNCQTRKKEKIEQIPDDGEIASQDENEGNIWIIYLMILLIGLLYLKTLASIQSKPQYLSPKYNDEIVEVLSQKMIYAEKQLTKP